MDYTVKQKGHWWRTRCPHHGGRSLDSLGLTEHDEDGHVSLHCFSGCDTKDILGAMGLTWRDLYTAPGEDAFNCTDLGNAERLIARHGDDMRYVPGWGWLVWSGKTWRRDEAAARERAKQTVRAIYDSASSERDDTRRQKLAKHAATSENASRINAMLQLAESTPAIQARVEDFDVEPWLLNVENGTIHLRTGQLHPHHREDLITKMAPVVYDPEAVCSTWHAFLDRIMNRDGAMGAFLARAVGYSLSGDTTEQKWFFLHGLGANGKTTFTETLGRLMGDYADALSSSSILVDSHLRLNRNDLAKLPGARLVAVNEAEGGKRLAEALVKELTGGDTIVASFKYKEEFRFVPVLKLWFRANHKPEIHGTDHATWRRILQIPFEVTIPEAEWDHELANKLWAEAPGILAWAVAGCLDWRENGLNPPAKVTEATQAYRAEQDILGGFLEDCCDQAEGLRTSGAELYAAYKGWAERSQERPVTQKTFSLRLAEKGLDRTTYRPVVWFGIGLR
jgi:putative DNA primase/helicase